VFILIIVIFENLYTQLRRGGIFSNRVIANCLRSATFDGKVR